jgi:hypothetical protein
MPHDSIERFMNENFGLRALQSIASIRQALTQVTTHHLSNFNPCAVLEQQLRDNRSAIFVSTTRF